MTQTTTAHIHTDDLNDLTEQWKAAKQQEADAAARRIAVESRIYEITQASLPEKGTYTTDTGMKITTGYTEKWDDAEIAKAYQSWPVESVRFPFEPVYKPDGKAIGVIREGIPDLYRLLQPALTLTPKKPAFSVKG